MVCNRINMGGGVTAIICARKQRPPRCSQCKGVALKLCDYPTPTRRNAKKTCDLDLCQSCAVKLADRIPRVGEVADDSVDLCPSHHRLFNAEGWPQPAAPPKASKKKRVKQEPASPQLNLFGET